MSFKKTITVYIEECPEGPDVVNAGDLLFLRNNDVSDECWSVHRYSETPTGEYWQALSDCTYREAIKWQFGIDLPMKPK